MNSTDQVKMLPHLMTEREISVKYGIPVRTLQKWRLTGSGPCFVKLGRAVRYRIVDMDSFIESRLRKSTSDMGRD